MKGKIKYVMALHPIQEKIFNYIAGREYCDLTLRGLAEELNLKIQPQQIKHHLTQLVRYGFVNVIDGKYVASKKYLKRV